MTVGILFIIIVVPLIIIINILYFATRLGDCDLLENVTIAIDTISVVAIFSISTILLIDNWNKVLF